MSLFCYDRVIETSVVNLKPNMLVQFMDLKSSPYKEGTKTLESTRNKFWRNKTFRAPGPEIAFIIPDRKIVLKC